MELFARRGDPHAAARALIASADDPRVGASEVERAGTLVAAAEILRKRLELPADAGMLLERAVTLDPASAEALEALEALSVDAGDFDRLAEVLERKVEVVARGPREQKTILARLAEIYDKNLGRPLLAQSTYERLLKIDPAHAAAREYLARQEPPVPSPVPPAPSAPPTLTGTLPPPPPISTPSERPPPAASGGDRIEDRIEDRMGEKYWRSAGVESEPVLRANSLVAKARVSLSRGEIAAATDDLELRPRRRAPPRRRAGAARRDQLPEAGLAPRPRALRRAGARRPTPPRPSRASRSSSGVRRWRSGSATPPRRRRSTGSWQS